MMTDNKRTHSASLDLALIGNSSFGALIDKCGQIVWSCMPRFDSTPVFDALLRGPEDEDSGLFSVELANFERTEQRYLDNTAILETILYDSNGAAVRITDFAPRFKQFGRVFRPTMIVRIIEPVSDHPYIRMRLQPSCEWGASKPHLTHGSNHIRYVMPGQALRLSTDASITSILDETSTVLDQRLTLIFGPDETINESISEMGQRYLKETCHYWHEWVRYLGVPFEWQREVIRAAITLKLNAYEDTGAIIAAMTTSIPEAPGSVRNWDYRYCWLRDSYFVLHALNRLGVTLTLERYLRYIINIAADSHNGELLPLYRINGRTDLDETVIDTLSGYQGMGPVRVGNQAYEQKQNDIYGSVILSATHVFFDHRMSRMGDVDLFEHLEWLGNKAYELYDKHDAGLWEFRDIAQAHTYSAVMCWAGCDRLAKIATQLGLTQQHKHWRQRADEMHIEICKHAWSDERHSFVDAFDGDHLDASLLLLNELGFLEADDPRFVATVETVEQELKVGDYVYRYVREDDFGTPETAFTICTFWFIDALAAIGRIEEARELFSKLLARCNSNGLLSEDMDAHSGELWGNFPQTYSMVGLINSAKRLSIEWKDAF